MIRDQSWLISDFRVVRYHYTGHMVYVAQLVVAVVLHTTGHRFDPCRVYKRES